jgi:hypothetical protein
MRFDHEKFIKKALKLTDVKKKTLKNFVMRKALKLVWDTWDHPSLIPSSPIESQRPSIEMKLIRISAHDFRQVHFYSRFKIVQNLWSCGFESRLKFVLP